MDSFKVINVNVKIKRFEELLSGIYEGIKYWIFKMVSTLKLSFCHPSVSLFKYVCISGSWSHRMIIRYSLISIQKTDTEGITSILRISWLYRA